MKYLIENYPNFFKGWVYICILVIIVIFAFSFLKVAYDTKEMNCITYYTSLGYTGSGCDKYIERFVNAND